MSPLTLEGYLIVGAALFVLGAVGFLARRNLILMVLSVETMLQGVALNLVAFARFRADLGGQVLTLFVLTVAACEAAIALTLIVMLYHRRHSLDVSVWQDLREPGQEAIVDEDPLPEQPTTSSGPTLTPAGPAPRQPRETSHV